MKRVTRFAIAAIVVGLSPLLVAWACVLFSPLGPPDARRTYTYHPPIPQVRTQRDYDWCFEAPDDWPWPNYITMGPEGVGVTWRGEAAQEPLHTLAEFSGRQRPFVKNDTIESVGQIEMLAGWPFAALVARASGEGPTVETLEFRRSWAAGLRVADVPKSARGIEGAPLLGRSLPIVPLWPGYLANAAIAAAVLLPIPIIGAVRRGLRRRASRCVHCGYPLGDSDHCTECGHARAVG
jgi:hypothetical protein